MSTWVVGHGMVPLLVPEVFPPVDFFMQVHVFIGDTWHHPYISTCFVDNVFTFLVVIRYGIRDVIDRVAVKMSLYVFNHH